MIFSTGIKKIYESISKKSKNEQDMLLSTLSTKISNNAALSHKYKLTEAIKKNKNSFSKEQAKFFISKLKEAHNFFMKNKENNPSLFYKEEKALFEYFNVNQKDVISDKLDLIINKKDNTLNESLILEYVIDKNAVSLKEHMMEFQPIIKNNYHHIYERKDIQGLGKNLDFIATRANKMSDKNKKLISESIKVIKEESFKNFKNAVGKAYRLDLIVEKIKVGKEGNILNEAKKSMGPIGIFPQTWGDHYGEGQLPEEVILYVKFPIWSDKSFSTEMSDQFFEIEDLLNDLANEIYHDVISTDEVLKAAFSSNFVLKAKIRKDPGIKPGQNTNVTIQFIFETMNKKISLKDYYGLLRLFAQKVSDFFKEDEAINVYLSDEKIKKIMSDPNFTGGRKTSYTKHVTRDANRHDNKSDAVKQDSEAWLDDYIFRGRQDGVIK